MAKSKTYQIVCNVNRDTELIKLIEDIPRGDRSWKLRDILKKGFGVESEEIMQIIETRTGTRPDGKRD